MIDFNHQNKKSPEVYHSVSSPINLSKGDMETLKGLAYGNERKRVRFCSHQTGNETVHEMFIVHPQNTYVRPHKHVGKIESMLVLQGEVDYITFDDQGNISGKIEMGDLASGKIFYNSLREEVYHTLLIRSKWLVFLEITQGPFQKENSVFPEWGPIDQDTQAVKTFMQRISKKE